MVQGKDDQLHHDIPSDTVHLDGKGVILRAGTLLCRLVGLPEDQVVGTPLMSFIAPSDRDRCSRAIDAAFLGTPDHINCIMRRPNGIVHSIRWLFRQVAGGVEGVIVLFEGHEKATPEVESGRYRALIRSVPGYVFILDSRGRFKEMHAPESGELVFPPEMAYNKNIRDLFSPSIAESTMAAIAVALHGGVATFSYNLRLHGVEHHFEVRAAASGEDEVIFYIADITTQQAVEELLRHHLRNERILTEISDLILQSDAFSDVASTVLSKIGGVMGADRVSVVEITSDNKMQRLHDWEAPSILPLSSAEDLLPLDTFSWWRDQLLRGETLILEDIQDIPEHALAERDYFRRIGLQSIVVFPIRTTQGVSGFVAVQNPENKEAYKGEGTRFIRIAGEIIGHALTYGSGVP